MTTLILIVQTFTGAMAYEYGPYPDVDTCEQFALKQIEELKTAGQILKVVSDCRVLYPELNQHTKLSDITDTE